MAYLRRSFPLFFIPLPPSNLRPFGAPPSIGRRECPREPLPMEGAAERSEVGLASFWGGEAASSLPSPLGKGDRAAVLGCSYIACLRRSPTLFHAASTLSSSLRSPPSPRGEGFVCRCWFFCVSCIRFGYIGLWLAALAFCANKNRSARTGFAERFWFYYSTVTDFARFLGLSTSFPLLIEV